MGRMDALSSNYNGGRIALWGGLALLLGGNCRNGKPFTQAASAPIDNLPIGEG